MHDSQHDNDASVQHEKQPRIVASSGSVLRVDTPLLNRFRDNQRNHDPYPNGRKQKIVPSQSCKYMRAAYSCVCQEGALIID